MIPPVTVTTRARHRRPARSRGNPAGNERLTALTGAVLLLLFAAEGVTILRVHELLTLHFFLGMLLVGPVLLKIGSTVFRFARYYAGLAGLCPQGPARAAAAGTRTDGHPHLAGRARHRDRACLHRAGQPVAVPAQGNVHSVVRVHDHPRAGLRPAAAPAAAQPAAERARSTLASGWARWLLLAASLACGLILAGATLHLTSGWDGSPQKPPPGHFKHLDG